LEVRPRDFPEQYKFILGSEEGARARRAFAKFGLPGVAEDVEDEEDVDTQPVMTGTELSRLSLSQNGLMSDDEEMESEGSVLLASQNGSGLNLSDRSDYE